MIKVSIITPTNKAYIDLKTVNSVTNQTNKDFEWVVVGDGIVTLDCFPHAKYISLFNNYGPSVARNIGFQVSDGDYITYLDNGDELSLDRVEHIISTFEKHPPIKLLFDSYIINQYNENKVYNMLENDNYLQTHKGTDLLNLLWFQNISIPMGVSHTRKPFVECGGFQRGVVCGEDGILWRRMLWRCQAFPWTTAM